MHFKYAENSVEIRVAFIKPGHLILLLSFFNLRMIPPMSKGSCYVDWKKGQGVAGGGLLSGKRYLGSMEEALLKTLMWPSSETIPVIWEMTPAQQIFGFVLLFNLPLHFREIKASTTGVYAGVTKTQPHISQFHSKPGKANQWGIMEWDKISSVGEKTYLPSKMRLLKKAEEAKKKLNLGPISQEPTIHQGAHLPMKPMRRTELKTKTCNLPVTFSSLGRKRNFSLSSFLHLLLWCFQLRFAYLKIGNVALTTPVSNVFLFIFRFWNQAGSINHASSRMKWEILRSTEISRKVERWSHPSYSSASCNNCTCLLRKTRCQ